MQRNYRRLMNFMTGSALCSTHSAFLSKIAALKKEDYRVKVGGFPMVCGRSWTPRWNPGLSFPISIGTGGKNSLRWRKGGTRALSCPLGQGRTIMEFRLIGGN